MPNPKDYNFWFQKAMNGVRFIEDIQRSLKLNPHHIESWIYYAGYFASSVNENDNTVEVIKQLLKYKPKPDISLSLFEYVLKKVQEYTDDDAPLNQVKSEPPYFDPKYYMRYCGEWLIVATYYWKKNKISEAWEAFVKAFSFPRNKNKAILWYIHLVLNLMRKKHIEAIENGEKAVEIDPMFKYAWQQLGKAYFYKGNYNQANSCIERALRLDNNFEPALKLNKEVQAKIEDIKKIESLTLFSYQRQQLDKEERDFMLELERECEKPIPLVGDVKWEDRISVFGFVVKSNHIVELGLTLEANSIKFIPESIKNLKFLEVLVISGIHNLQKFPESIIFLKNLKYLKYQHCAMNYNPGLKPNVLPKVVCNLRTLEKLNLDESYITTIPECLAFLPNLIEINLTPCPNLKEIPLIIKEYFEYKEYQRPLRKYLIRKKKAPKPKDLTTPEGIINKYLLKLKSETQTRNILIEMIEKSDLLQKKITGIELLKKLPSSNEEELDFLERLMTSDQSYLIRSAAADVMLHKFSDKAYESIKSIIMNEKDLDVIDFFRKTIQSHDSITNQKLREEFKDYLTIIDIEKLIRQRLSEITDFEVIKKKNHQIQGPNGYIKRGNRITHLGLHINSNVWQLDLPNIPSSIGDLDQLEELKLINCRKITNLPEDISRLKNLKKLVCIDCRSLHTLPEKIGDLENLEYLKLSNCYSLRNLPSTISKLKKLKILDLSECWTLISLPDDLKGLKSLRKLNLENCFSLKYLPKTVTELKNLEEINLSKCRNLETLPSEIGNMNALQNLSLRSCNHLIEIPKSIGNLIIQKKLDLSYCYHLTNLPETIENLKGLQKIILRGCRELKSLPESIGNLYKLEEINLYACRKLISLPKSIGKLSSLKILDLSYCESLISFPKTLENLNNLKFVRIEGCNSLISSPEVISFLDMSIISEEKIRSDAEYKKKYQYYDWDIEFKKHQATRYSELKFAPIILTEKVQKLIKNGVNPNDSEILVKFFRFLDWDLSTSGIYEDLDENQGDMRHLHHYKINDKGKVTELHLHCTDAIYLSIFPEYICSLDELEVIRFPNNLIESIPECISNLKSLRTLVLRNIEAPNPKIPDSLKSYVQSLENYNEF